MYLLKKVTRHIVHESNVFIYLVNSKIGKGDITISLEEIVHKRQVKVSWELSSVYPPRKSKNQSFLHWEGVGGCLIFYFTLSTLTL